MIYFIYGNQSPTINSQIKKITTSFLGENEPIDEFNFVKIDGFNVTVQEAVDECKYVSLGYDKKVVSIENCYFFCKPKPRNKIESDQLYDVLEKYVEEDNDESCVLIMSVVSSEVDLKNPILNLLKEKGKIIQIVDPDEKNFIEYIKAYCSKNNVVIDRDALNELASRCDSDVALLKNSIEKLSLYTDHIRYADVIKMVTRKLEDNAFLLTNMLIEGRNVEAVNLFKDLKVNNVEPITLVSQLASQFRLLNQIRFLSRKQKLNQEEIAKELKIKPGRVYIMSKSLSLISEKAIINTLEELYVLDYEIKSGQVDRYYAFELFLLKFKRN